MSRVVLLDAGPLGLVTNPKGIMRLDALAGRLEYLPLRQRQCIKPPYFGRVRASKDNRRQTIMPWTAI